VPRPSLTIGVGDTLTIRYWGSPAPEISLEVLQVDQVPHPTLGQLVLMLG
jgi:hypothetical protein